MVAGIDGKWPEKVTVNSNEGSKRRTQTRKIFAKYGDWYLNRRPSLPININPAAAEIFKTIHRQNQQVPTNQQDSRIHCSYCQQLDVQSQDQHNAKRYPLLIPAATSKCGVAPLTSAKPAGVFSQNQPPAESPSAIKTTTHPVRAKGKLTRVDNHQAQLYKSVDACKHTQSKLSTDSRNGIASTNPNDAAQDTQSYIPTTGHPVATSKQRTQYPMLVIQSQPQNAALQLTQTTSLQTRRKHLAKYQTHATMLNQQDTISNQSQATGTLTRVDSHRPKPAGTPTALVPQTTLKSVLYRNTLMQRLDTKTR
ncbi:kinesin-4-like [Dorcoceras hygrometricum]|uniref:Kinesin-4-like n=1 Tax=Dorcoceras hygrometricum TaxID=472368 RepID=A0A2Z7C199_9LAMI|nr:kinesin-4-like [Dorcoceras hygrometricum]